MCLCITGSWERPNTRKYLNDSDPVTVGWQRFHTQDEGLLQRAHTQDWSLPRLFHGVVLVAVSNHGTDVLASPDSGYVINHSHKSHVQCQQALFFLSALSPKSGLNSSSNHLRNKSQCFTNTNPPLMCSQKLQLISQSRYCVFVRCFCIAALKYHTYKATFDNEQTSNKRFEGEIHFFRELAHVGAVGSPVIKTGGLIKTRKRRLTNNEKTWIGCCKDATISLTSGLKLVKQRYGWISR